MATLLDYYEALQVHPSAEPEVIQAAYRRLALKYHPDVYHGRDAQERMALLNRAYAVLNDPQQRAAYDKQRNGGVSSSPRAAASPELQVASTAIDLGSVAQGQTRTFSLRVSNMGHGQLSGVAVSHVPWLRVSPAEFTGNSLDLILRFQGDLPGNYQSAQALELYSNGGRTNIAVRGLVVQPKPGQTFRAPDPTPTRGTGPLTNRPSMQLAKAPWQSVQVPFSAWVIVGTLVTSFVWFNIVPALTILPLGLGSWLLWQRHLAKKTAPSKGAAATPRARAASRGEVRVRCRSCGASMDVSGGYKCTRCGGTICPACNSCPCGNAQR